ncbi:MAG: hypothetical protein FJ135_02220 [Deltaproteobacteria bacterium]|nr:hypothetical protein [Deltaproteobacteria bacterium]
MKKSKTPIRQSKRDLYHDEARSLYLAGVVLKKIAEILPVSLATLKNWRAAGHWGRKKDLVTEHPRLVGEALKGLVRLKVRRLLAGGELAFSDVEELNKLLGLIERLAEQVWDERAATVEVMGLFGDFLRRQVREKEELRRLAQLIEKFFEFMEGR